MSKKGKSPWRGANSSTQIEGPLSECNKANISDCWNNGPFCYMCHKPRHYSKKLFKNVVHFQQRRLRALSPPINKGYKENIAYARLFAFTLGKIEESVDVVIGNLQYSKHLLFHFGLHFSSYLKHTSTLCKIDIENCPIKITL